MKMYCFSLNLQSTFVVYPIQAESLHGENLNNSFNKQRWCLTYPFCLLDLSALIG
jgi:hypothetical protein